MVPVVKPDTERLPRGRCRSAEKSRVERLRISVARITHVPPWLWSLLWLAGTLGALAAGGALLV